MEEEGGGGGGSMHSVTIFRLHRVSSFIIIIVTPYTCTCTYFLLENECVHALESGIEWMFEGDCGIMEEETFRYYI